PQAHDTREQGQGRELTKTGRIKCHNGDSHSMNLPGVAKLAGWPTPKANDCPQSPRALSMGFSTLTDTAQLAIWPTPTALSFNESHQPGNNRYMNKVAGLASCSQPTATKTETAPTAESTTQTAPARDQHKTSLNTT